MQASCKGDGNSAVDASLHMMFFWNKLHLPVCPSMLLISDIMCYELAFDVAVQHGILHHKLEDGEGISPDGIAVSRTCMTHLNLLRLFKLPVWRQML